MRAASYMSEARGRRGAAMAQRRMAGVLGNASERGIAFSRGELKAKDTSASMDMDTTGTRTLLNGIARGDDIADRTGRQINMRSIELRCFVTGNAAAVDQHVRLLVVYDRQTNAAQAAATDVLVTNEPRSLKTLENRERFVILVDKQLYLNAAAEPGTARVFKMYRRMNLPTTFNSGDAGTVADITTGSLFAMSVGNQAPGNTAATCYVNARLRYQDN